MSFYFCNNLTFCLVSSALKFMALSKHDEMQMCILEGIKLWCEDNISDLDRDDQDPPKKRQRVRPSKINYGETNWGRILSNPRVKDPESREGKLFRLRFRCPFALFEEVLMPFVWMKNIIITIMLQRATARSSKIKATATKAKETMQLQMVVMMMITFPSRDSCVERGSPTP